jgi:hypothetical protein
VSSTRSLYKGGPPPAHADAEGMDQDEHEQRWVHPR